MDLKLKLSWCIAAALVVVASGAAGIAGAARAALAANGASTAVPDRGAENAWQHSKPVSQAPSRPQNSALSAAKATAGAGEDKQARGTSSEPGMPSQATAAPEPPEEPLTAGWEAQFVWGIYYSKMACLAAEHNAGSWAWDGKGSRAGVPQQMLRAEDLLAEAVGSAPETQQRAKMAERALRLYYHAKWLAERNHATACEWRYREASRLARQSRRNVLAAHALGRLGYFLMHWRRIDEAKEALQESRRVSQKSNPLAPYLLGMLDRQAAGSDVARLMSSEEMVIHAGEQPSSDLENERQKLMQEITYWRKAKESPMNCWSTSDAAHLAICVLGHLFFRNQAE